MKQLILDTNVIKDLLRDIIEACTDDKMHLADKKKIQKEVDQSWLIFFFILCQQHGPKKSSHQPPS